MGNEIIQADYEELEGIAKRFAQQSEQNEQLFSTVRSHVDQLKNGGWQGRGANSFYEEMESELYPAVRRLVFALNAGKESTQQLSLIVREAEEEAAKIFGGSKEGSATSTNPNSQTFWDRIKIEGKIWEFDPRPGKGGKFDPEISIKYAFTEGALFGNPTEDGVALAGGKVEGGFGFGKKGWMAGLSGEIYALKAETDGVIGSEELGLTGGAGANVLKGEGFVGIKDGSLGATIGGTLVSVEGEVGANVAGVNVGLKGEVGLKAELGFKIGKKTELKLPFITIGFSFGKAKKD